MPGSSSILRGNALFLQCLYLTVTPPTVTTAVITPQNVTVPGLVPGDIITVNMTSSTSTLISIAGAYVSANNVLTLSWTSEGATVTGAAAQTLLIGVLRPENVADGGVTLLPNAIV
jgi:hypothetical protein